MTWWQQARGEGPTTPALGINSLALSSPPINSLFTCSHTQQVFTKCFSCFRDILNKWWWLVNTYYLIVCIVYCFDHSAVTGEIRKGRFLHKSKTLWKTFTEGCQTATDIWVPSADRATIPASGLRRTHSDIGRLLLSHSQPEACSYYFFCLSICSAPVPQDQRAHLFTGGRRKWINSSSSLEDPWERKDMRVGTQAQRTVWSVSSLLVWLLNSVADSSHTRRATW